MSSKDHALIIAETRHAIASKPYDDYGAGRETGEDSA
jgi:hypothetical protein